MALEAEATGAATSATTSGSTTRTRFEEDLGDLVDGEAVVGVAGDLGAEVEVRRELLRVPSVGVLGAMVGVFVWDGKTKIDGRKKISRVEAQNWAKYMQVTGSYRGLMRPHLKGE